MAATELNVTVKVALQPDDATTAWLVSLGWTPPPPSAKPEQQQCSWCPHTVSAHTPDGCIAYRCSCIGAAVTGG